MAQLGLVVEHFIIGTGGIGLANLGVDIEVVRRRTTRNGFAVFGRRAEVLGGLTNYRNAFSSFVSISSPIWAFDALRRHCIELASINASDTASQ